jgi:leucyl aminopeptidase
VTPPRFEAAPEVPAGIPVLGVPVFSDLSSPPGAGAEVNPAYLTQRRFEGKPGQAQALLADDGTTVIALGVGERGSVDADALRRAGAALARQAGDATEVATTLAAAAPRWTAAAVEGIGLGAYRFGGARKKKADNGPAALQRVVVVDAKADAVRQGQVAVDATWRARDWVNRPARDLTPTELARVATEVAAESGVKVDVWDEDRIAAERLGGLLGVAAGSAEPPRLLRLEYEPAASARRAPRARGGRRARNGQGPATIALVGKGITFDSGGLSLKPPGGMMTMKSDMGGAAAVISATAAIAQLELPVRVVGWVAATENMPSGTAIHPGDVIVARNGTSIEVLNTDAEGRLVLADALSLAAEEEPDAIIDIATLTGGQRVALGAGVAAVMGTEEDLVRRVIAGGAAAGEPAWELPLFPAYRRQLDSDVADLRNVSSGPAASAIMAALFLKEFSGGRPWAHLDIAAPSYVESDDGWITKGATGWGTRTLIEVARAWS